MAAVSKPHSGQFQPGNRLGGRPLGSRNRLTEVALRMLGDHFAEFEGRLVAHLSALAPAGVGLFHDIPLRFIPNLIPRACGLGSFDCVASALRYPDYRSLAFVSADAEIAKTGSVWVVVPLPAPRQVTDLIVVPSSG